MMEKLLSSNGRGYELFLLKSPEIRKLLDPIYIWMLQITGHRFQILVHSQAGKGVARLIRKLIKFQNRHFGKNAVNHGISKIPMKYLTDFQLNGALCCILNSVWDFHCNEGWTTFSDNIEKRIEKYKSMYKKIWDDLIKEKFHKMPNVFIKGEVDEELREQIKKIIKQYKGTVTESEEATHIIYPGWDLAEGEYARPIVKWDESVFIHWNHHPDSCDSWVEEGLSVTEPNSELNHVGPWRVNANWVLHLDKFNEWMNEIDYEVDENGGKKLSKFKLSLDELTALLDKEIQQEPNSPTEGDNKRSFEPSAVHSNKKVKFEDELPSDSDPPLETRLGGIWFRENFLRQMARPRMTIGSDDGGRLTSLLEYPSEYFNTRNERSKQGTMQTKNGSDEKSGCLKEETTEEVMKEMSSEPSTSRSTEEMKVDNLDFLLEDDVSKVDCSDPGSLRPLPDTILSVMKKYTSLNLNDFFKRINANEQGQGVEFKSHAFYGSVIRLLEEINQTKKDIQEDDWTCAMLVEFERKAKYILFKK